MVALLPHQSSNLYSDFVTTLRTASAISGRITTTDVTQHGTTVTTEIFSFKRPNFSKVQAWRNNRMVEMEVSDGKIYWMIDPIRNRVNQVGAEPGFIDSEMLLEPFMDPKQTRQSEFEARSEGAAATFHGRGAIVFDLERVNPDGKVRSGKFKVFIDPHTGLPVALDVDRQELGETYEILFNDLKIDPILPESAFQYKPDTADRKGSVLPKGAVAPLFKGTAVGERPFSFAAALKGAKAVVLDFWGIGCIPCRQELPELEKLQKAYGSQGLKVVTIDLFDDQKAVAGFVAGSHLGLPVIYGQSCVPDIVFAYKATIEPTLYIVGGDGRVVGSYENLDQVKAGLFSLGFR
jgi:thiol-disulfide isomerase/thioredoxin